MNKRITLIAALIIYSALDLAVVAQGCVGADFEMGHAHAYTTYTGSIDDNGVVTINTQEVDPDQHRIMSVADGFDPIASANCITNKFLPVVPPTGGRYAMRLGNEEAGAQAERAVLSIHVTNENNFFLLTYAVVLEDPAHDYFEQPRFELRILDENGAPFDCGEYMVRAGPDIPDFENCGNWRVRPWTTVGFELQSYIGQDIQIELLTTDCSRSGHAGYAYFDATCQPLEIQLLNFCTDSSLAIMRVTEGFLSYQWSTGHSTSSIQIDGPVTGDIYYVTVTSASGCELILSDTIPLIETVATTSLDPSKTYNICDNAGFWYRPLGVNLDRIYSPDVNLFLDSFWIQPGFQIAYTFIAYSDFGCGVDSVIHYFIGEPEIAGQVDDETCLGRGDGRIEVSNISLADSLSFRWSTGDTVPIIDGLLPGSYELTVTSRGGCMIEETYHILDGLQLNPTVQVWNDLLCAGETNGSCVVFASNGHFPYQYSFDGGVTYRNSRSYNQYPPGEHVIYVRDAEGCLDSVTANFEEAPLPQIISVTLVEDSCGLGTASITVDSVHGLQPPFIYSIGGPFFADPTFLSLPSGSYQLKIKDQVGCENDTVLEIPFQAILEIEEVDITRTTCDRDNGSIEVMGAFHFVAKQPI